MIDRQKLEALLSRRFPGSTSDQVAAAANAVMALAETSEDGWPRACPGRRQASARSGRRALPRSGARSATPAPSRDASS